MLADHRTAPISEKLRAALVFLEKLTLRPAELMREDAADAYAAGVSKAALEDAIHVAAGFNIIDRIADATNFDVPDAVAFEKGATVLLRFGYKL